VANNDTELAKIWTNIDQASTDQPNNNMSEVQISQEPDAAVTDPDTDQIDEDAVLARLKSLIMTVR
jgi:hypothetical protein